MKTPETFLLKYSPVPHNNYKNSWVIKAMKEYAKQWVEEAAMLASSQAESGGDVVNTVLELRKEIDDQ